MALSPESSGVAPEAAKRRVLVVDDDVELCALVSEFLRREGIDVEAVHDGEQGLRAALAGSHDAIILDVMLPGIAGFDVLRKLREQKRTPVLMLTARGDHVDRVVGLEMGADDYIPKPFDPRELVARIRAVLRRATASAGPRRTPMSSRSASYASTSARAMRGTPVAHYGSPPSSSTCSSRSCARRAAT
jgi:two-component system response regulator CpxR